MLKSLDDPDEIDLVKTLISNHAENTSSMLAYRVLSTWDEILPKIVKLLPKDYDRMLQAFQRFENEGYSGEEAIMAAFELNSADLTRDTGN